ncbi:helix-turn-helix domain-containing protein [Natranaerobius trueperi]|uniref:helix-turn-helix domain-containing protein n=1 Tax=Natranaerobius trueperi TaxID=759412 RepID=UPI001303B747|nr:helix-turn-helix domain-containing protein [Natranaerobius trueperi]
MADLERALRKAQAGDKENLEYFYFKFEPLLYKHSIVNGRFDEDCFNELSLALIKAIKRFEPKNF